MPLEVTPHDGNSRMLAPHPSTCVEVNLPCGSKVRFGADVGVELAAEIIAALKSKRGSRFQQARKFGLRLASISA